MKNEYIVDRICVFRDENPRKAYKVNIVYEADGKIYLVTEELSDHWVRTGRMRDRILLSMVEFIPYGISAIESDKWLEEKLKPSTESPYR